MQSRYYVMIMRQANITDQFLGNTFPLLGSRFLIMKKLD
jgi:hypothetical protein